MDRCGTSLGGDTHAQPLKQPGAYVLRVSTIALASPGDRKTKGQ
jgi:hypothetical protein